MCYNVYIGKEKNMFKEFNEDYIINMLNVINNNYTEEEGARATEGAVRALLKEWSEEMRSKYKAFGGLRVCLGDVGKISFSGGKEAYNTEGLEHELYLLGKLIGDGTKIINKINCQDIMGNKLTKEFKEFDGNGKVFEVKKGSKTIKALLKFIKTFDVEEGEYSKIITNLSKYRQEVLVSGDVYLSIDPLDFITCSVNGYNWTSCFSLEGEYLTSPFKRMFNDKIYLMFISSKMRQQLGCEYHDKKMRSWIYSSKDGAVETMITEMFYPYTPPKNKSEELSRRVWDILHTGTPHTIEKDDAPYSLVVEDRGAGQYVDFLESKNGAIFSSVPELHEDYTAIRITNQRVPCLCCGMTTVGGANNMFCPACSTGSVCTSCEEVEHASCWGAIVEGNYHCENCLDELFEKCDVCGNHVDQTNEFRICANCEREDEGYEEDD